MQHAYAVRGVLHRALVRSLSSKGGNLIGRFDLVPVDLFRIQSTLAVRLADHADSVATGKHAFDFKTHADGMIHPVDPTEPRFMGPNGMSMRPANDVLASFISGFRGKLNLYRVPAGTRLPPDLVVLHEHTSHYSMQCTRPMKPAELNKVLSSFLQSPPCERVTGKEEVYKRFPDLTPAAHGFSPNGQ